MATLEEKTVPAYFTAAWNTAGDLIIQQLQSQLVLFRDGVPDQEGKLLPIELIKAPHANDTVTPGLLETALSAAASGQLLALAKAQSTIDAMVVEAASLKEVTDQAAADALATANKAAADSAAELAAKDANIQALMAQVASLPPPTPVEPAAPPDAPPAG